MFHGLTLVSPLWRTTAAAVLGGTLIGLGFPSVLGTPAMPAVLLIGLVLVLRLAERRLRAAALGLLLGNAVALAWLPLFVEGHLSGTTTAIGWVALSLYGALYSAAALALARWTRGRSGWWTVSFTPLWFFGEVLRARLFGGFDWLALGHVGADVPLVRWLCAHTGAHAVSAAFVAAAALLVDGWARRARGDGRGALVAGLALAAGLVVPCPLPAWGDEHRGEALTAAVLQGHAGAADWGEALLAAADQARLVITAEGAVGEAPIGAPVGAHVLLGAQTGCGRRGGRRCVQNATLHYSEGRLADRYAKRSLVPIYEGDFAFWQADRALVMKPGDRPGVLDVDGARIGVLICYEIVDASATAELASLGAEVLVHPTSDTWQRGDVAAKQHLNIAKIRAAEFGIPILRVSNRTNTASIDALGRAQPLLSADRMGVAKVDVETSPHRSWFARHRRSVLFWEQLAGIALLVGYWGGSRIVGRVRNVLQNRCTTLRSSKPLG